MTITLRNTKGQALTFNELDGNFTDLDSRILTQSQIEGFIDSSYIKGFIDSSYLSSAAATRFLDSADAISLIDSAYVNARADFDSGEVVGIIDSNYIQQRTRIGLDDIDFGMNKITYANMYSNLVDLPNATTYHGMFAHVHATGKGYFAHGGNWIELANQADIGTTITSTVDSAYVTALIDSHVTNLIDSAYVTGLIDSHVTNLIDSDYISARSGGGGSVEFFSATGSTTKKGDGNVLVFIAGGGGGGRYSSPGAAFGGASYGAALFTNLTDGTTITVTAIGAGGPGGIGSNGSAGGTTTVTAGGQSISISGGGGAQYAVDGTHQTTTTVSGGAIMLGRPANQTGNTTAASVTGALKLGEFGEGGSNVQSPNSARDGHDGAVLLVGV